MSNDYFNYTPLVSNTTARATDVNNRFTAAESGFALLPGKDALNQDRVTAVTETGAANAYVVTLSPAPGSYANGLRIVMEIGAGNTNTGACTVNVNSLGARAIKLQNGNSPAAGDLAAGDIHTLVYESTSQTFYLHSPTRSHLNQSPIANGARFFDTRAEAVTFAASNTLADGNVIWADGLAYEADSTAVLISDMTGWKPWGDVVTPNHFATNSYNSGSPHLSTDMLSAFNTALTYVKSRGKVLTLRPEKYYLSGQLKFPVDGKGVQIIGPNAGGAADTSQPCWLVINGTTTAAVWMTESMQRLEGVAIVGCDTGSTPRYAAADTYAAARIGIRIEDWDGSNEDGGTSGSIDGVVVKDVLIWKHNGDAIVICGQAFNLQIDNVAPRTIWGRPAYLSSYQATSRTQEYLYPGQITFRHFRPFDCGGPTKFGDRDDDTTGGYGCYRVTCERCEFTSYVSSVTPQSSINPDDVAVDIHGEEVVFNECSVDGNFDGTPANFYTCLFISGRFHAFNRCRFVANNGIAIVDDTGSEIGAEDIMFMQPYPVTSSGAASTYNPAIAIQGTPGAVTVIAPSGKDTSGYGTVSAWFTTGFNNGTVLSRTAFDLYSKQLVAATAVLDGASTTALSITRDSAVCGLEIERTGTGAGTITLQASADQGVLTLYGNAIAGRAYDLDDDTAAAINPPEDGGVMIVVFRPEGGSSYPQKQFSQAVWYDCGASEEVLSLGWTNMGADVNLTTGALGGTTGTDGKVTISAEDTSGVVYIENRSGFNGTFAVTFL